MTEQATTANKRSNIVLGRTLPTLTAAFAVWALVSSFLALDTSEYGLVTRFGRVVRVLAEPGLHVVAPFDRVVRLDKRVLFFRPAPSEYLTIDKKNITDTHCPTTGPVIGCDPTGSAAQTDGRTFSTVSTVSFIAGGVLLAGGITLILLSPRPEKKTAWQRMESVHLRVAPNGMIVGGSF